MPKKWLRTNSVSWTDGANHGSGSCSGQIENNELDGVETEHRQYAAFLHQT